MRQRTCQKGIDENTWRLGLGLRELLASGATGGSTPVVLSAAPGLFCIRILGLR
jgi:hypothetical protein